MSDEIAKEFFTFGEIAADLGVSHSTVRNLLRQEPDVVPVGKPGSKRPAYRVPTHVYARLKQRLSNPPPTARRR